MDFFFYIDLLQVRLTKVHNQVFFHKPLIQGQFINDKIIHVYGSEKGILFWGGGANKKEHHEIT